MRRLFWLKLLWCAQVALWGEGMEKERVGSGFKRKAPIGTPFLLSNLSRDKKSYSLVPQDIFKERRGVIGQHSLCQSTSSSKELQINTVFSLLLMQLPHPVLIVCLFLTSSQSFHTGALVSLLSIKLSFVCVWYHSWSFSFLFYKSSGCIIQQQNPNKFLP